MAIARVVFDESHSQAWTIRADVAKAMQPAHPEDSSYARAAAALRAQGFAVHAHFGDAPLPLDGTAVLVLAHSSEPQWERTVPGGRSPRLTPQELDAIDGWVHAGGGLIVLAEEEQAKYGNNLDELTRRFGIAIANRVVSDYDRHDRAPHWVLADPTGNRPGGVDLLARVSAACFYRATTLDGGLPIATTSAGASAPSAPLLAVAEHGAGRVIVTADSDLFGDDCIGEHDHAALWLNLVHWAAGPALARPAPRAHSPASVDPHWHALRDATDGLRVLEDPDGSTAHDVRPLVERMTAAIEALSPRFPQQTDYLDAVIEDLNDWTFTSPPDFTRSLAAFRPDLHRSDGIEHLVVFPMYLQNASRDRRFEALIVRVPWPEWLAELESTRYDNPKFVPVTFVDNTAGYDSECAVLFPETVCVSGRPVNNFGGIFCDRESQRFRDVVGRAAKLLGVNLPPDAAALLHSERLSQDAYMLWDLIHDRAHSHGDLPFDPFMIRQRSPYWMYSLEELRCDLTAFCEAGQLQERGLPPCLRGRDVRYAILFDRLFRFPITGSRVRNYDGLGGQLLFAYLHKHGHVHWTDNRLTIEWETVASGVAALRAEVEALYRDGIDRSKVAHWIAAHDLVAGSVPATAASRWARDRRALSDESDPKPWLDAVDPDEFPLSMFYTQLGPRIDAEPQPVAA